MKRLIEFVDVTATALLLSALLAAFYWLGLMHAQAKVRADCDGLGVVLLTDAKYECLAVPKKVKLGGEP